MIRRSTLVAVASAAMLVALLPVGAAAAVIESGDANGDGYLDYWGIDDNGDGIIDRALLDANTDGFAEVVIFAQGSIPALSVIDTNGDRRHDVMIQAVASGGQVSNWIFWRDVGQDGRWENGYYDGNLDGFPELVSIDTNADGTADTWVANGVPGGYSATAAIARQVAAVGAMQILMAGNVPIIGPMAWPVGG